LGTETVNQGSLALDDDGFETEVSAIVKLSTRLVTGQSTLYVGGLFDCARNVSSTKGLAKWDFASSTWKNLGGGVDGNVRALVENALCVYIGGTFSRGRQWYQRPG
jgi:hypothetical protein